MFNIQKLPWAGIRVESETARVAIDPLFHFPAKYGEPHEPMVPLDRFGPVDAVLATHQHGDHFDPEAIDAFYGADIPVYLPSDGVAMAAERGLTDVHGVQAGDSFRIGSLEIAAAFSVDGVGVQQVAWIVRDGDRTLIHCGDTLWHGQWWNLAKAFGPFDAACLPVNGAIIDFPDRVPSGQPICLTPEQAVAAAVALGAGRLVPIHYGTIHCPPLYRQTENLMDRLKGSANGNMELILLKAGESLKL